MALLQTHGLKPSRALGQNFVVDPNTVRRIARLAQVGPGDQDPVRLAGVSILRYRHACLSHGQSS